MIARRLAEEELRDHNLARQLAEDEIEMRDRRFALQLAKDEIEMRDRQLALQLAENEVLHDRQLIEDEKLAKLLADEDLARSLAVGHEQRI